MSIQDNQACVLRPSTEKHERLAYIHINQAIIARNKKLGENHAAKPSVITVKRGSRNDYCYAVRVEGESWLRYHPATPLACGARATLQASRTTPLTLLERTHPDAQPLKFRKDGLSVVRIHVHKQRVRSNIKRAQQNEILLPVFTVKVGHTTTPAQSVHFLVPVTVLYCPHAPFGCAEVWLELRGRAGHEYVIEPAL